jgi:hypothetical protein
METIDLEIEMNFIDAVTYLLEGKCIGIRPRGNSRFLVKEIASDFLCWNRSMKDDGRSNNRIRLDQYTGIWYAVIIDSNKLPENIKNLFVYENISSLLDVTN